MIDREALRHLSASFRGFARNWEQKKEQHPEYPHHSMASWHTHCETVAGAYKMASDAVIALYNDDVEYERKVNDQYRVLNDALAWGAVSRLTRAKAWECMPMPWSVTKNDMRRMQDKVDGHLAEHGVFKSGPLKLIWRRLARLEENTRWLTHAWQRVVNERLEKHDRIIQSLKDQMKNDRHAHVGFDNRLRQVEGLVRSRGATQDEMTELLDTCAVGLMKAWDSIHALEQGAHGHRELLKVGPCSDPPASRVLTGDEIARMAGELRGKIR